MSLIKYILAIIVQYAVPSMEHILFQHSHYAMDSDCPSFENEMSRLQIRNLNVGVQSSPSRYLHFTASNFRQYGVVKSDKFWNSGRVSGRR